jgi:ATP-dependent protease ClpP protease subunit
MAREIQGKAVGGAPEEPKRKPSPWLTVRHEVLQGWELRQELITKIEQYFKGKVVVFFTSFQVESAGIDDKDAEMIENILSAERHKGRLLLILSSPGGDGLAAERIVNVCRSYSGGDFRVIVPHMAKSAATLICFGASRIHMGRTAELGPVDPQVKYAHAEYDRRMPISAEEYVRSYEQLMEKGISGRLKRLEPIIQQLQRYDARYIEQLRSWQALSQSISIRLLKSGMMSRLSEKEIKRRISAFLVQKKTRSHGRMITMSEASKCGLVIDELDLHSDPWGWIWELYIRADCAVSTRCSKILESANSGLSAGVLDETEE